MPERVYKLHFKGPLHVGTWGIGREETLGYIPSDTLFGALVVAWASLSTDASPAPLEAFLAGGAQVPFRLTSAFPFAGSVRFFPRPLRYLEWPAGMSFKRIKKVAWVSESIFHVLCRGEVPQQYLDGTLNLIQGGSVWLTRAERESISRATGLIDYPDDPVTDLCLWREATVPRVTVDRISSASNLFHSGRVMFAPGCGLWLAARGGDLTPLESGMTYLQDTGLGGLRAAGHGAFELEPWLDAQPLVEPGDGGYFVTLARYAPTTAEFDPALRVAESAFGLETIAGWCSDDDHRPWRRKRVRLVGEGAFLGWPGYPPGRLVDVTPDGVGHFADGRRVYRYGLAFPVGVEQEVRP